MINLCRIFGQKDALFINHSVDIPNAAYGLILSLPINRPLLSNRTNNG